MTKDVIVTISGLQFAQETETEPVEIVTAGSYYKKNGKHYIIYDEVNEGFSETTRNIIKLNDEEKYHLLQYAVWKPVYRH